MKYAFMSFSCPELTLGEMLNVVKRFGYDGVEPRIQANHKHGIELDTTSTERSRIAQAAARAGVPLCCIATSCSYANPEKASEQVEMTHRAIDLAGDLAVPCIRVFGGMLPDGVSREQAVEAVGTALAQVATHAAERKVTICVETHDGWCNPHDLAALIRAVNHPAIGVNWDIMHPVRAGGSTMDEAFEVLRPWIRHVHFHDGRDVDGQLRLVPIGEGIVDHRRAVHLLKQMNYAGYLSGEWIGWEPWEVHLPRELGTMKRYDAES